MRKLNHLPYSEKHIAVTIEFYPQLIIPCFHPQVFIRVLDHNDNGPTFSQPSYDVTISEDAAVDTEILHIKATDKDEKNKLTYSIHSSIDPTSMRKFLLDQSTGRLSVVEKLDHEAQAQHSLTVMVSKCLMSHIQNLLSDSKPLHIKPRSNYITLYDSSNLSTAVLLLKFTMIFSSASIVGLGMLNLSYLNSSILVELFWK